MPVSRGIPHATVSEPGPGLQVVTAAVESADETLESVPIPVDRRTLARRIWRGTAADGCTFGFDLTKPLTHGATVWQTDSFRYQIEQLAEDVVEISLELAPSAAAGIGWAVGNLHLDLSAESGRLLAPDEPAVRRLLERLQVPYAATTAVFRPGRFSRNGKPAQELGPSHKHDAIRRSTGGLNG